jgi:hypothetical protein
LEGLRGVRRGRTKGEGGKGRAMGRGWDSGKGGRRGEGGRREARIQKLEAKSWMGGGNERIGFSPLSCTGLRPLWSLSPKVSKTQPTTIRGYGSNNPHKHIIYITSCSFICFQILSSSSSFLIASFLS